MKKILFIVICFFSFLSCKKEAYTPVPPVSKYGEFKPTPYTLLLPSLFTTYLPPMPVPSDNSLTVEGVELGRRLFYDKILSGNGQMSCASCHRPERAFSDGPNQFTTVGGSIETRNTPSIMNIAWANRLFWDGRATSPAIENQALSPVVNPNEMNGGTWLQVVGRLQHSPEYPGLFYHAFGSDQIDSNMVVKAIAQFERILISGNSRMDKYSMGQISLSADELAGRDLFMTETGNCFHCHGNPYNPLWTANDFFDNGLDAVYTDLGYGATTGSVYDNGKFKAPTLRNLVFTAPYMHDGRFATLEDVIEQYSTGVKHSANLDANMYRVDQGGANFTQQQKNQLIAFLKTLTDSSFVVNPAYQAP
jgi:cytochrome c peroxidase